jgi:hypothetical protein
MHPKAASTTHPPPQGLASNHHPPHTLMMTASTTHLLHSAMACSLPPSTFHAPKDCPPPPFNPPPQYILPQLLMYAPKNCLNHSPTSTRPCQQPSPASHARNDCLHPSPPPQRHGMLTTIFNLPRTQRLPACTLHPPSTEPSMRTSSLNYLCMHPKTASTTHPPPQGLASNHHSPPTLIMTASTTHPLHSAMAWSLPPSTSYAPRDCPPAPFTPLHRAIHAYILPQHPPPQRW